MPRLKKGARLWFRKARSDQRGNTITRGVWIIIESGPDTDFIVETR